MQIVEVRLKFDGRLYTLFSDKFDLKKDDFVVCQSAVGESFGKVESVKNYDKKLPSDAKFILKVADEKDKKHYEDVVQKSRDAVKIAEKIVKRLGLEMSIVNAEYSFDMSKVVIDFIAEDRVDFRDLIKELVSALKSRIELKQIGIREQAKIVGGIGICGRACCCSSHLKDFEKVSIKMAKVQGLALNPQKISGACGRLMCCLSYENDFYTEVSKNMPKVNSEVVTKDGRGTVVYQNMLKETVSIKFVDRDGTTTIKDYNIKDLGTKFSQHVDTLKTAQGVEHQQKHEKNNKVSKGSEPKNVQVKANASNAHHADTNNVHDKESNVKHKHFNHKKKHKNKGTMQADTKKQINK